MPASPDIKRFSINKEDTSEGGMRVLHSGVHKVVAPAYMMAAREFEEEYPGQLRVEEAIIQTEDGTRRHPRDPENIISAHQTVIFIETPHDLYQPLMQRTDVLKAELIKTDLARRQELTQQLLAARRIESELSGPSFPGDQDHQIVPLPTADVFPYPEPIRATGD